ncbi:hypothetical protein [Glutamicibacter sp. AOP3-A1-12]|uniref:hypothetical protein n=1 Tax=Glutamicibacter sp. AOP3-A1-12 TaxID=3457701 RepID=UPI00403409AA
MATRLDLAYDREVHKVRTRIVSVAGRAWLGLGSYRDADFDRMLATLIPRIETAQQQVANLTDSYIRKQALAEFGRVRDGTVFNATTRNLRGVGSDIVYHRPFASTYAALSSGKAVQAAIAEGGHRLTDLVSSGVQLSKTHAAAEAMGRSGFTKYMRTLTGRENCAMCTIASTQRYHRGDLLPIHPGCDCGIKPFVVDPGDDYQVIDESLLESTHDQIASKLGDSDRGARLLGTGKFEKSQISDYTDLILTREHGELGPTLTWRTDKFTGTTEIN